MASIFGDLSQAIGELFLNNRVDATNAPLLSTLGIVGSSSATNLYLSLHSGSSKPSALNELTTATYVDYARAVIPRQNTPAMWTRSAVGGVSKFTNASAISFPTAGVGSSASASSVALWASASAGSMLAWSPLTTSASNKWKLAGTNGSVGGTTTTLNIVSHGLAVGDKFIALYVYDPSVVDGDPLAASAWTEYEVATAPNADTITVTAGSFENNTVMMVLVNYLATGPVPGAITITAGTVPTIATGGMSFIFS